MMCANKYENRQNDEYECCTPFHPYLTVCKQKKIMVFCSATEIFVQNFNRICSLLRLKTKKCLALKKKTKQKSLLCYSYILNFPPTELLAKIEFHHTKITKL